MPPSASTGSCSGRVCVVNESVLAADSVMHDTAHAAELSPRLAEAQTTYPQKESRLNARLAGTMRKWAPAHPSCMEERHMLAAENGALTGIHDRPASTVARYEALIRVSEALRAYHDRDTLFRSLARELRPVVRFTFLGLGLYDEQANRLDLRVLEATGNPLLPPELSAAESLTYWTVQHQAPLVIPNVENETRFPKAMAYFRAQDVRSTCSLPLTTPRRRIGMLVAGDSQREAYDTKDVTFLSLVANQVALAIDDALNHSALQQSLVVERERQ